MPLTLFIFKMKDIYNDIADLVQVLQEEPKEVQEMFHEEIVAMLDKNYKLFNDPKRHLKVYQTVYNKVIKDYNDK